MSNTGKQRRRLVMLQEGADTSGVRDVLEGQCDVEKREGRDTQEQKRRDTRDCIAGMGVGNA